MLKLPQKDSTEERSSRGREVSVNIFSQRSLRHNNSSRIWRIMQRHEMARQFEQNPKKSPDAPPKPVDSWEPHDKALKIPVRKKTMTMPSMHKGVFKSDGSMMLPTYRKLKKQGHYSLHQSSSESTFGKTPEEIDEFYNSLIHKPGRRMAKIILQPIDDDKCEETEQEQLLDNSDATKEQEFKDKLKLKARMYTNFGKSASNDSSFVYNILPKELLPGPKAIFLKNNSSQMKSLLLATPERQDSPVLPSINTVYTGRKNSSVQMAEIIEMSRPQLTGMNLQPQKICRRRVFGRQLHCSSRDFPIGKTEEELSRTTIQLGVKFSKRVFPHMKPLENNWPDYPPAKFSRKRRILDSEYPGVKRIAITKKETPSETTVVNNPGNLRVPQYLGTDQEKMLRRSKVSPYHC